MRGDKGPERLQRPQIRCIDGVVLVLVCLDQQGERLEIILLILGPAIEDGQLLLMVDVGKRNVGEVNKLVKSHHPEVQEKGTEPEMPPFP